MQNQFDKVKLLANYPAKYALLGIFLGAAIGVVLFLVFDFVFLNRFIFPLTEARISKACDAKSDDGQRLGCYKKELSEVVWKQGAEKALKILARLDEKNTFVHTHCHAFTHEIGEAGYKRYGNVGEALAHGDLTCFAGYFHGVFLAALPEIQNNLEAVLPTLCEAYPFSQEGFRRYQCVHGLGHGLTVANNYEIFKAIDQCDLLKTQWDQISCSSGVFMENAHPSHFGENYNPPHLKLDDPLYPCTKVDRKHWLVCYSMTSAIVLRAGGDISEAFQVCQKLQDSTSREFCYQGVGRAITGVTDYHPEKSITMCLEGPRDASSSCLVALALGFSTNYASLESGANICHNGPENLKPICFRELGRTMLPSLHGKNPDKWAQICNRLAGEFAKDCLLGAPAIR